MSEPNSKQRRIVPLLVRVYALLLWLYPARFRREYGEEMLRVLRERVRDTRGADERVWLWGWALGDLIVSALAERMKGELQMEAKTWERVTAVAAVVSGIAVAARWLATPVLIRGDPFLESYVRDAPTLLPPVLFLFVAAVLTTRLWRHQARLVAVGFALVLVGSLLQLVVPYLLLFNPPASVDYYFMNPSSAPLWFQVVRNMLLPKGVGGPYAVESPFAQIPFILGLALLGIALLRTRPLPRGNSMLLIVAVCALIWDLIPLSWVLVSFSGLPFFMFVVADQFLEMFGAMFGAMNVFYGLVWVVFGVMLWRGTTQPVPVPATNTR